MYSVIANRIRTDDPLGFNKGRSSRFRTGSRVQQTPEEGRKTYRPKRCGNNHNYLFTPTRVSNVVALSSEIRILEESTTTFEKSVGVK